MTYRNPYLLRLAAKAPRCMACGAANEGQVVSAHSNQLRDEKGMGTKASDAAIAFICALPCHYRIDQGNESKAIRIDLWERAHRATMRWLIESGHLLVSLVPTPPPVVEAKPKAKIAKRKAAWPAGRKLQGRGFDQTAPTRKIQSQPFPKRSTITSEGAG